MDNNFSPYDMGFDPSMQDMYKDPMLNPMMQYEQAYMYYRYLTQQLDYKLKCKEYEKICKSEERIGNRKIE